MILQVGLLNSHDVGYSKFTVIESVAGERIYHYRIYKITHQFYQFSVQKFDKHTQEKFSQKVGKKIRRSWNKWEFFKAPING